MVRKRGEALLTLCLNFVALGEGEEGGKELRVVVLARHGEEVLNGVGNGRDVVGGWGEQAGEKVGAIISKS